LKGIVASAPVIISITSRPVLAGGSCTVSGQMSGNTSDAVVCAGEGCTPGFWKQDHHYHYWHKDYKPDVLFGDVFGTQVFRDKTLAEVINKDVDPGVDIETFFCTDGRKNLRNMMIILGFHAVAALQNAATSVKFDVDVQWLIDSVYEAMTSRNCSDIEALKNTLAGFNEQGCPW